MLDYDREAETYDETRGGMPRARAAADAVLTLLPPTARTLVDVGCGTGSVTTDIARGDLRVWGVDPSPGMLRLAAARLGPSHVVQGAGHALPLASGCVDAVSMIWILHLIRDVEATVAEAARVLRPGGRMIVTVDKDAEHDVGSDLDELIRPYRHAEPSDRFETIRAYARRHALVFAGEGTFAGHGQGRTPQASAAAVRRGYFASYVTMTPSEGEALAAALDALPDPTQRRPDPVYRLVAFEKAGA